MKKKQRPEPMCRAITFFTLYMVFHCMQIEQKAKRKRKRETRKQKKIIVVMAARRRAMKELGKVAFSPDITSGGGSPRVSLRDLPERERENKILCGDEKGREVSKNKNTHI